MLSGFGEGIVLFGGPNDTESGERGSGDGGNGHAKGLARSSDALQGGCVCSDDSAGSQVDTDGIEGNIIPLSIRQ